MTEHNANTNHPRCHPNERTDPTQNPTAHPTSPTRHPHHHPPSPTPNPSSTFEMGVWGSGPTSWGGTYAAAPPPPAPPSASAATWTPNYPPGLYSPSYDSHSRNNRHQQLWFQNQQFSGHLQPQRSYVGGDHQPLYGQYANLVSRTSRAPTMGNESGMPKPRKCVRFVEDECSESFRK